MIMRNRESYEIDPEYLNFPIYIKISLSILKNFEFLPRLLLLQQLIIKNV